MRTKTMVLALALAAVPAAPTLAAEVESAAATAEAEVREVRVVNHYRHPVLIDAQDAHGKMHRLGRVARGHLKFLELPAEIAERGAVRLKVFASPPVWALGYEDYGIRSDDLELPEGTAVNVWLGTELTRSQIQVERQGG